MFIQFKAADSLQSIVNSLLPSQVVHDLNDLLLPALAIWLHPVHGFIAANSDILRRPVTIGSVVPQLGSLRALHSQGIAGADSLAVGKRGSLIHGNAPVRRGLPLVQHAQPALLSAYPVHLFGAHEADSVRAPPLCLICCIVPLLQQVGRPGSNAGLPRL